MRHIHAHFKLAASLCVGTLMPALLSCSGWKVGSEEGRGCVDIHIERTMASPVSVAAGPRCIYRIPTTYKGGRSDHDAKPARSQSNNSLEPRFKQPLLLHNRTSKCRNAAAVSQVPILCRMLAHLSSMMHPSCTSSRLRRLHTVCTTSLLPRTRHDC